MMFSFLLLHWDPAGILKASGRRIPAATKLPGTPQHPIVRHGFTVRLQLACEATFTNCSCCCEFSASALHLTAKCFARDGNHFNETLDVFPLARFQHDI